MASQFDSVKGNFTDETVELTEKALEELATYNESLKGLVTDLVGGAAKLSRGWLKWSLKTMSWKIRDQKLKFDGAACKTRVAANFKSLIYLSAM